MAHLAPLSDSARLRHLPQSRLSVAETVVVVVAVGSAGAVSAADATAAVTGRDRARQVTRVTGVRRVGNGASL